MHINSSLKAVVQYVNSKRLVPITVAAKIGTALDWGSNVDSSRVVRDSELFP